MSPFKYSIRAPTFSLLEIEQEKNGVKAVLVQSESSLAFHAPSR